MNKLLKTIFSIEIMTVFMTFMALSCAIATFIENAGIDEIKVRSVVNCASTFGVCAKCYGRDLARGKLVNTGEAVGVIAAQSIGEPGTQLTMRTFHIGGAASRAAAATQVESKSNGTARFSSQMRYVANNKGELIVIGRSCEVVIHDDVGRERERHKVPYGATLMVRDGEVITAGHVLATWDPHTRPMITEHAGRVRFENIEEGVTVAKQTDEVTGLSTLVVIDGKRYRSMTSLGKNVTFGGTELRLEANIFDFEGDIYGKTMKDYLNDLEKRKRQEISLKPDEYIDSVNEEYYLVEVAFKYGTIYSKDDSVKLKSLNIFDDNAVSKCYN